MGCWHATVVLEPRWDITTEESFLGSGRVYMQQLLVVPTSHRDTCVFQEPAILLDSDEKFVPLAGQQPQTNGTAQVQFELLGDVRWPLWYALLSTTSYILNRLYELVHYLQTLTLRQYRVKWRSIHTCISGCVAWLFRREGRNCIIKVLVPLQWLSKRTTVHIIFIGGFARKWRCSQPAHTWLFFQHYCTSIRKRC